MTVAGKQGATRPAGALVRRWVRVPARYLSPAQTARLIASRERQAQALELRKAGMTFQEIADALKFKSAAGAGNAVRSAIDRLGLEAAKDVVIMDLARLDEYMKRCTAQLRTHNDLSQIDRLLRIMDKKHQILGITTETFREEQARASNVSVTNNAVMVVQGSESSFVREMMKAVGMDMNSPEVQQKLAALEQQGAPLPALPPGSSNGDSAGAKAAPNAENSEQQAQHGRFTPAYLVGEVLESRTVEDAMQVQAFFQRKKDLLTEPIRDGIDAPLSVPDVPALYVGDVDSEESPSLPPKKTRGV